MIKAIILLFILFLKKELKPQGMKVKAPDI